jgi:hypothetical protein
VGYSNRCNKIILVNSYDIFLEFSMIFMNFRKREKKEKTLKSYVCGVLLTASRTAWSVLTRSVQSVIV